MGIPVRAGDLLGMKALGAPLYVSSPASADNLCSGGDAWTDPAPGDMLTSTNCVIGARINVTARIEHDADGDGRGDESQDLCPSDAARFDRSCSGTTLGPTLVGGSPPGGAVCLAPPCTFSNLPPRVSR